MLALETGWTDDTLGNLPSPFRAACHWALYARAIAGDGGLPDTTIPPGGTFAERAEAMRRSVAVAEIRKFLFPEDDGV